MLALRSLRRTFLGAGVFSLAANLLLLTPTLYMLQIYDRVLISRSELTLLAVSLVALLLYSLVAVAEWARARWLVQAGVRFDHLLTRRVLETSLAAHWPEPLSRPTRALNDLTELRQFMTGHGMLTLFDVPWTPIYIGVMWMLHPGLGLAAVGFVLVQAGLAWWGHRRTVAPALAAAQSQSEADNALHRTLRHVDVVEVMGMRPSLQQRWISRLHHAIRRRAEAQDMTHRLAALSKWVRHAQQSLVLALGAVLVVRGDLSPGAMVAANLLMTRALSHIDALVSGWRGLQGARAAYHRLNQLLATQARVPAPRVAATQGAVVLQAVTAYAPGRKRPLLHQVDLTLLPGQLTVAMGPSGSGKSTLARVVLGIWPDVQGLVCWGPQPLTTTDRPIGSSRVGYLPQDIALFDGTIADNIARMGPVDSEQVVAAARAADLHDTILRLPKGYDTPIGHGGGLLSGGQRQRIALARALYGQPDLLVLDEPNAHLDDAGERALLHSLRTARTKGQTVLLISHRASVLALADQLVLLHAGRVQWAGPREAGLAWLQAQRLSPTPTPAPPSGASLAPHASA